MFVFLVALAGGIAVWECQDEMCLRPCSDARLCRWRVMSPTLVLFIGGRSGLGQRQRQRDSWAEGCGWRGGG
jgi:hypothetical protein